MHLNLRMQLNNLMYDVGSGEATWYDLSPYDWYSMWCAGSEL